MRSKSKGTVICLFLTMIFSISFFAWSQEVDENTVLWFTFDEEFKEEIEDISGNGNNGTVGAGVEWLKEGKIGGCAKFAGIGGITVPYSGSLDIKKDITLECFFQNEELPKDDVQFLFDRGVWSDGAYLLWIDNKWGDMQIIWNIQTAVRKEASLPNLVKPGEWQYVGATYDGEKMKLYLDGQLVKETAQTGKLAGGTIIIGGNEYMGLLDEVRISNVVRDASEIEAHMEREEVEAVNPNLNLSTTWGLLKSK